MSRKPKIVLGYVDHDGVWWEATFRDIWPLYVLVPLFVVFWITGIAAFILFLIGVIK